jgi:hypothetical protein
MLQPRGAKSRDSEEGEIFTSQMMLSPELEALSMKEKYPITISAGDY